MPTSIKVAAVQAAPEFMDLDATVDKTIELIRQAAAEGCQLVAFPECWIPGYPWYIWLNATALNMKYFAEYHANCIPRDGKHYKLIADAARDNNIHVSTGASEQDHGSLYISQFLFSSSGETLVDRRKLKPTHMERTVFGDGNGSDLRVVDTDIGRVGQLACWEHLQPLSKYAMYSQHEQIHIGCWPSFSCYPEAYALGPTLNTAASQLYAAEGQCFVIAPCGVISQAMIDRLVENEIHASLLLRGGGHARIYGPDGAPMGANIEHDEEGLVIAELDMSAITYAKCFGDPVGHYARPDATALLFNNQPQPVARSSAPQAHVVSAVSDESAAGAEVNSEPLAGPQTIS